MNYSDKVKIINDSVRKGMLPVMFLKLKISERNFISPKSVSINTILYTSMKFQTSSLESNGYHKRVL